MFESAGGNSNGDTERLSKKKRQKHRRAINGGYVLRNVQCDKKAGRHRDYSGKGKSVQKKNHSGLGGNALKYFEIQEAPELKYAPQLENWYGKFDVRDIKLEGFPRLPDRQLFTIKPSDRTIFTDIIQFPFLLLSLKVTEVIKMYRERCFCRDVILLDQISGKSELYQLPVFDETDKLSIRERQGGAQSETVVLDKHIFWVRDSLKRHTIISLDLAESLLRREVTGLGLKEIELSIKE